MVVWALHMSAEGRVVPGWVVCLRGPDVGGTYPTGPRYMGVQNLEVEGMVWVAVLEASRITMYLRAYTAKANSYFMESPAFLDFPPLVYLKMLKRCYPCSRRCDPCECKFVRHNECWDTTLYHSAHECLIREYRKERGRAS